MIDNLLNLIKYKTYFGNKNEIDNCFEYIRSYYNNTNVIIKDYNFNSDRCMIISNTKDKDLDVIFCGHIDVVYGDNSMFVPNIDENFVYGRGSLDMKGSVSVMMKILKDFEKSNMKIALFLTSDEERGGFNGTNMLLNCENYTSKISFVPDGGLVNNSFDLITEEKGVLQLKLTMNGKGAHSSQVWNGKNAILELMDIYNRLIKKYPLPKSSNEWKTSINLSIINGGDSINKVPENASMIFDIRFIAKDNKEDIYNSIKSFNDNVIIETIAYADSFKLKADINLINVYKSIVFDVLGKEVFSNKCESSSDARFFSSNNIPCILNNPEGKDMHGREERVLIESLDNLYKIYSKILKQIDSKPC